jgi:hypothetical protein
MNNEQAPPDPEPPTSSEPTSEPEINSSELSPDLQLMLRAFTLPGMPRIPMDTTPDPEPEEEEPEE